MFTIIIIIIIIMYIYIYIYVCIYIYICVQYGTQYSCLKTEPILWGSRTNRMKRGGFSAEFQTWSLTGLGDPKSSPMFFFCFNFSLQKPTPPKKNPTKIYTKIMSLLVFLASLFNFHDFYVIYEASIYKCRRSEQKKNPTKRSSRMGPGLVPVLFAS